MQHAGLRGNHQNVIALLLVGQNRFRQLGAFRLAQIGRPQAACDAVLELAFLGQSPRTISTASL